MINTQRWYFPLSIFLAACFGVFVLPFLLPPPYLAGISAANVAGFNNKVASVAAAAVGTFVCFAALKWPRPAQQKSNGDFRRLSWPFVLITVIFCGCMVGLLSYVVATSHQDYGDGRYFMRQISMYTDYGRRLYDQIELPYGPLIFYGPVIVRALLSPFHASAVASYYTTLVLEQMLGLLSVAYVLNHLPILHKWKIAFLLICLLHAYPFHFGVNATLFRFVLPIAFLALAAQQRRPWLVGACLFAGEALSLSLSPEMGFAFAASSMAYGAYYLVTAGRTWLVTVIASPAAIVVFFLLAGVGYLRMLKLFAHGILNFVVEPLPYVLVFLFALVWLVPLMLARFWRERRSETPLVAAIYIFSLALLPVAFGRADPGHVFFNGISIYLLSLVAISDVRPRQQVVWVTCVVLAMIWTAVTDDHPYWSWLRARVHYDTSHWQDDGLMRAAHAFTLKLPPEAQRAFFSVGSGDYLNVEPLDTKALDAIVGNDPVALPYLVPPQVEEALKRSGQYVPTFYDNYTAVLDESDEDRQIKEMNASRWALLPQGPIPIFIETPATVAPALGPHWPYRLSYWVKREPYPIGRRFQQNLAANWQPYAAVGKYELYRRRGHAPASG